MIEVAPSGPRNARIDPDSGLRKYYWQGVAYPSVTSIRSMAGMSFALHNWAISRIVTRATEENGALNRMLSLPGPEAVKEAKRWLRAAATEERDRAADLGTRAHEACLTQKQPGEVAEDLKPFVRQFRSWMEDTGVEIIAIEKQVWNLTLGYAGSFDMMVRLPDGSIRIVDLKTGKGTYPEHALQTTAYAMAEFIGEDDVVDEGLTRLFLQASSMSILHITPVVKNKQIVGADGWSEITVSPTPATADAFKGLLTFAKWIDAHPTIESVSEGTVSGAAS